MEISALTQRLLAIERPPPDGRRDLPAGAAFRVCEKLRQPLCVLAGVAGYRSLLSRARTLALARAPWLAQVKIGPDGALGFPPEVECRIDQKEADRGGALLVSELLGLLSTLIGDTLTLRLVRNVWPDATTPLSENEMDPS